MSASNDMPKHKEVRAIAERLVEQGWRLRLNEHTSYVFAYPPDPTKRPVKLPTSPGSPRWRPNLIGVLRRSGARL